jgi:hypothetical protein
MILPQRGVNDVMIWVLLVDALRQVMQARQRRVIKAAGEIVRAKRAVIINATSLNTR